MGISAVGRTIRGFALCGVFFFAGGICLFFWPAGGTLRGEGAFVFSSRRGLFFSGLFFFWREGGTISWAEPGWEAGQGGKKAACGRCGVPPDHQKALGFSVNCTW